MMHRKFTSAILAAVLALALVVPVAAFGGKGKDAKSRAPQVRGKLTVEGIVTAVNSGGGVFSIQVTNPGHARRAGSMTLHVLVQQATELQLAGRTDDGEDNDDNTLSVLRRASIADIRVGDRVTLEGFRLDDGRILALRLRVKNRAVAAPGDFEFAASGVVTSRSVNALQIVSGSTRRAILITPSTDFRGQRTWFGAIQPGDFVMVAGMVNADGSIVARRVETTIGGGTSISGRITSKSTAGPLFLMLNNSVAVNLARDTQVLSFGQIRSVHDLQVGQMITVTGVPLVIGGVTVAINARTITF
ncbi:MAG: DUF5666 domain-containing protein [bacterium]